MTGKEKTKAMTKIIINNADDDGDGDDNNILLNVRGQADN